MNRRLLSILFVLLCSVPMPAAQFDAAVARDGAALGEFVNMRVERPANPPFSFQYAGKAFAGSSPEWAVQSDSRTESGRSVRTVTYSDRVTGLKVSASYVVYSDYPAVEWVLRLRNEGAADTPIIEGVRACSTKLGEFPGEPIALYRARGSNAQRSDFAPLRDILAPSAEVRFGPSGGRSSDNTALPFFNVAGAGRGVVAAIGWSGKWIATLKRDATTGVTLEAGMERTRFLLHPGEEVRSPSIALLFWKGDDRLAGHNLFRRFVLAHHSPRPNGQALQLPLSHGIGFGGPSPCNEYVCATESYALAMIERLRQFGLEPEACWIDAGWYEAPTGKWWQGVGNWVVNRANFPRGLRPIADAAKTWGKGFVLWFEPERVYEGTRIDREHPEWVQRLPGDTNRLFKLGDPQALKWMTDYISAFIANEGVTVYRQDFNFDPAPFWRAMDSPDRVGVAEMKHIEGLYTFWDALLARNPGLLIDNCASGGRRIDLETIGRSVPLWRTDYSYFEPNGYQCHTYGLQLYLPNSGTGNNNPQKYFFRSSMGGAVVMGWEINNSFSVPQAREAIGEFKALRPFFQGDFYPLTEYSTSDEAWAAFQWDRPEQGDGIVLAFRRPQAEAATISVALKSVATEARYELAFEDYGITVERSGRDLAAGLAIKIPEAPGSLLIRYRRK